jgi:hypothetical protein
MEAQMALLGFGWRSKRMIWKLAFPAGSRPIREIIMQNVASTEVGFSESERVIEASNLGLILVMAWTAMWSLCMWESAPAGWSWVASAVLGFPPALVSAAALALGRRCDRISAIEAEAVAWSGAGP